MAACRFATHSHILRRRLYIVSVSSPITLYKPSFATTRLQIHEPIRQLSSSPSSSSLSLSSCFQQGPRFSDRLSFEESHAITKWQNSRQQQQRSFHSSPLRLDTDKMSAKEKKKALKAKAKAAAAAAAEAEREAENSSTSSDKVDEAPPSSNDEPAPAPADEDSASSADESAPSATTDTGVASEDDDDGEPREYSTPELTADAAKHKAGLKDETRPDFQNPLHHNNEDMEKIFPEDFDSQEEFEKSVQPLFPFDEPDGKVTAPAYLHEIADEIVHLTMLEMNELVNKIADHYGFHEGMLSPDGSDDGEDAGDEDEEGEGGEAGDGAPAEKKTAFDVKLVGFDAKAKIKVIKEVRSLVTGLGLKEAKELVEGAPKVIQKSINMELAEEIKAKLEELGAEVEII